MTVKNNKWEGKWLKMFRTVRIIESRLYSRMKNMCIHLFLLLESVILINFRHK